ncbi:MAG: hypothetical protein EU548_01265 [Promethearchaeota archaeon]|nr:MAG: hypothetical protein EU548_01265 [Candidatus Lokiarchaeota archaeon]
MDSSRSRTLRQSLNICSILEKWSKNDSNALPNSLISNWASNSSSSQGFLRALSVSAPRSFRAALICCPYWV